VHPIAGVWALIAASLAVALAGCHGSSAAGPAKLSLVAPLPSPALPAWIDSISPVSTAQSLAQVRVIFKTPVTKVEALTGDGPADVLSHVRIEPAVRGHFAVLTPRMIGFVAEQALPVGTRIRVTLTAGLRDLDGDVLPSDLAWTFETAPLALTGLPQIAASDDEPTPAPAGTHPAFTVTANAAVDPQSLAAHTLLVGGGDAIGVTVALKMQPTPPPGLGAPEAFDPSLNAWVYELQPQHDLRLATTYDVQISPGIEPAYGNLATTASYDGKLRTYGPLAIVPTPTPSPGPVLSRFAGGDPVIAFDNPLDPASIVGRVTVSPAPAKVDTLASVPDDDPASIAIDPYALDPDAGYAVTIAAGVKDVFGQTLDQPQTVQIRTSDFAPGAWAPSGLNVIPSSLPVDLNFYATNLPGNAYRAAFARVGPVALLGDPDPLALLPSTWPLQHLAGARTNVQSVVRIPLRDRIGGSSGALAYAFKAQLPGNQWAEPDGIAELTNLGVFAQWFPAHGIVMVQHLSDGSPAVGASVTAYRNVGVTGASPQPCARVTTNADGIAEVTGVDVERCYAGQPADQAPEMGVVASEGGDVAALTTQSYSGVYRFDVSGGWTSGAPLSRGTLFTDRSMYQPGETGELTGVAYYVSGNSIVADRNAQYKVTLQDPSNATTPLGAVKTDAYGVFSLPLKFSARQALGYYTLDAKGANGNDLTGSLRVAEFKPPNFKLSLTLSATSAQAGASVTAGAVADYLFGAPLQGGTAHVYVTRDVATLQPKGWDDYAFGPQWFWPEQTPSFDTDVLQRDLPLDAKGAASFDVPVPSDLPFPMTYRVDVETSDVSNLSVADSQSFLALPSDAAIGLNSDFVGAAGTPLPVRAIVTDANGKPVAGRAIHLELQKMTYTSAAQNVEGGESAQQAVKYDTVATADATSADDPVTVRLTPPSSGPYRIRANFAGSKGTATATDVQVFAFGSGEADWGTSDPNAIAVKLDKKSYAVGDAATALIALPFAKADVYVAVVRGDVLYRTILRGVSGAVRVPFRIGPEMLPNAAIEAVVVRRGVPLTALKPGSLDTLARVGMTGFDVGTAGQYLKIGIAPKTATVHPGGPQSVDFTLRRNDGAPVRGEIVAMVVNDAILQLSGYRLPDLVKTVFADQPISTIFSDNRENVLLKTLPAAAEKGFGYGGGFLEGAASTRVRANFRPMAYYGVVHTGVSGTAHVAFTMPDDLTTWRVMAVAVGGDDAHFATGDATFVSTQPLIANPLLPQFARTGDRFDAGISVSNQTGSAGALDFVLKLTGALAFASGNPRTYAHSATAGLGMQALRATVVAGTPAPTTFEATTELGTFSDAFEVPFVVSDAATTDSVVDAGATSNGAAEVPISLTQGGRLDVTVANSVVPQFATPAQSWMTADALPLADDAASRLIVASALAKLQAPYGLKLRFDPAGAIASSRQALLALQRSDGGFGAFQGARDSDPFVTAYALEALAFARERGVAVDAGAVSRAAAFTRQSLANPERFRWCGSDDGCKRELRFDALWALAATGDRRTDFLADIVANSGGFDSATQIRLARYLLATPGWQAKGRAMADGLEQTNYLTGRYATANVASAWSWLDSPVAAQAQMVQLLIERGAPVEQRDGALRALVAQQCRCGWPTMDDTASAMLAITAYAATEKLVAGTATVTAGGATIASARFGTTASSQTFALQATAVRGDALVIRSSGGTVHYIVLYTYPVAADAPGELAAFRVTRSVAEPGPTSSPIASMDLQPLPGVSVAAGRVFDVTVRTVVDHPVDRLVVEDQLPAGLEAVDTTFRTALAAVAPQSNSWEIDSQQIYRDKVIAYAAHLGPGVYDVHYLVRSVTPGTFRWPGARAYLVDAPEQFGRSAGATLVVH